MDEDAEKAALEYVSGLLQRPDHLEKLPELKKRADRKKAAVEAMLRTGVQSQLEGIRTAIAHLHTATEDINSIDVGIASIRQRLKPFPQLKEKMQELRDANARHSQYAAAMENMKHIFNINQTVVDVRTALDNGKLLVAHKHIMDLELARDELLIEVHKTSTESSNVEKNLLIKFFSEVDQLVNSLGSNMWFIIGRSLEMVKGSESGSGPQELVTCLRIVEREERIDRYYESGDASVKTFVPPNRPRRWKEKALSVLEKTVWSRIEGNQLEDRQQAKSWLARYLEVCRKVIVEDLMLARAAIPCFPPDYQIYDRFLNWYHDCIRKRIREIASDRLEKSEIVQLMSWVQAYGSEDLLGNRRLQVNTAALLQDSPILTRATLDQLYESFISMTRRDMKQWLEKTLSAEMDDWYKNVLPDADNHDYYYTSLPNILFGMLRDTVTLAKEVSVELIPSVINVTIEEFYEFASRYRDAFTALRKKYFENRDTFPKFTATMVAIANNIHTCIESTDKYMQQVRLSMENDEGTTVRTGPSRQAVLDNIDRLNARWNGSVNAVINILLEEVLEDIKALLADVFSRKWLSRAVTMGTICDTIYDYFSEHKHLKPEARCSLLMHIQFRVVSEYFRAIDSRRLTFASYDERALAGSIMEEDADQLGSLFTSISTGEDAETTQITILAPVIQHFAGIINLRDKSLISLEVSAVARMYPNVPSELLAATISTREDIGRTEAKSIAEETLSHTQFHPTQEIYGQLFTSAQSESSWRPSIDVANVFNKFLNRGNTPELTDNC